MLKFQDERVKTDYVVNKAFKNPIPIAIVSPIKDDSDYIFIFNTGLNATIPGDLYRSNPFFDDKYVVFYEKMAHGQNKNKPKQYIRWHLKELDCVVEYIKNSYPNKKIYLLGESWGSNISALYIRKYPRKISGAIFWNMPRKIYSPDKLTFKVCWSNAWKIIPSLIFNINLKLPKQTPHHSNLTRDALLARAMDAFDLASRSSLTSIAVWRSFRPAWNFILKNSANQEYNFLYIQSKEDVMLRTKYLEKLISKADENHVKVLDKGYHILSMEPEYSQQLFSLIEQFIKK